MNCFCPVGILNTLLVCLSHDHHQHHEARPHQPAVLRNVALGLIEPEKYGLQVPDLQWFVTNKAGGTRIESRRRHTGTAGSMPTC